MATLAGRMEPLIGRFRVVMVGRVVVRGGAKVGIVGASSMTMSVTEEEDEGVL